MSKPERVLARELLDSEVLDLTRGEVLGTVHDFVLSRAGRVSLIGVLPRAWYQGGRALAPEAVVSIHHDHICVESSKALSDFALGRAVFSMRAEGLLSGRHVLEQNGELLGTLHDFAFNLADGRILDVVVLGADGKRVRMPVAAIRTVGRDYVVIERGASAGTEPAETKPAARKGPQAAKGGAPPATEEALATAEAITQVLFDDAEPGAEFSKFDEKRRAFLRGRPAHRNIKAADGELLVAKDQPIDEAALERIVEAGLLGEVFIALTLKK